MAFNRLFRGVAATFVFGLWAAACSTEASAPPVARVQQAESDSFGLGSGRDGALNVTTGTAQINDYAALTAAPSTDKRTLTVDDVTAFTAGRVIMVWQTTGLAASAAPSGTQTKIDLTTSPVGRYEFARIESVNVGAKTILLTNPLVGSYSAPGAQIIRVPEYTTVNVAAGASIVPKQAWNGSKGGVVAFFASGTVTNDGTIRADAAGFRGGVLENNGASPLGCTALDGWGAAGGASAGGAHKGEGLVSSAFATTTTTTPASIYGRGNVSIGGGGGDCHNAGGAGGGHGGKGGNGGNSWIGDATRAVGGIGGAPLQYDLVDHLSFGGGGGAGEENNNVGSAGGAGGGVVWFRATALAGAGTVSANGGTAANGNNDGAGGGGAGGAVVVRLSGAAACTTVRALGGNGGSLSVGTVDQHGTGGGGAGGKIWLQAGSSTCPTNAGAGNPGTVTGGTTTGAGPTSGDTTAPGTVTTGSGLTDVPCSTADIAAGKCGGCVSSADCASVTGKTTCDLTTHTCVGCLDDSQCTTAQFCDTAAKSCVSKLANGTSIPTLAGHTPALTGTCTTAVGSAVCVSGVCDTTDHKCGLADGSGPCTSTSGATVCRSTECSTTGVCKPAGGCFVDADCASDSYCDTPSKACVKKLANGVSIPTVTGHTPTIAGTCSSSVAAIVCASGVCDTTDDKCGLQNANGPCTTGTQCRSAICDTDGKCGYDTGHGPCSVTSGPTVCRSGACGASSLVCIPAGGCSTDGDCTSSQYCNTGTSTCTAKLTNGTAIPTVPGHTPTIDGKCSSTTAGVVCQSGVCETSDDKCGLLNNTGTCTGNAQCRSSKCSTSLTVCVECLSDADCGTTAYCDATNGSCKAKKADGSPCSRVEECVTPACTAGSCGGPADAGPDGGDAAVDSGAADAGADSASDSEADSALDAPTDATEDADAAADAGDTGAVEDTGADTATSADTGATTDGDTDGGVNPIDDTGSLEGGGCGCALPGTSTDTTAGATLVGVGLALLALRRRR